MLADSIKWKLYRCDLDKNKPHSSLIQLDPHHFCAFNILFILFMLVECVKICMYART